VEQEISLVSLCVLSWTGKIFMSSEGLPSSLHKVMFVKDIRLSHRKKGTHLFN